MSEYKTLRFEIKNNIAVITLDRPNAANGLNSLMVQEMSHVALRCDNDADIKVVVLTGSGRFFSAGGDIKEIAGFGVDTARKIKALADGLHRAISTFVRMEVPVIVAVNGIAAGAGFSLSMIGDLVIVAESASFTMAYTKAGLSPDGSASFFLPRLIGIRKTQELMLMNKVLTAEEALKWGLITKVVADEALMDDAEEIAISLANGAHLANISIKKLLIKTFHNNLETQMEMEGRYLAKCAASENGREGLQAFVEKRPPRFS